MCRKYSEMKKWAFFGTRCSFSQFDVVASETYTTFVERTPQNGYYAVQYHSRSSFKVIDVGTNLLTNPQPISNLLQRHEILRIMWQISLSTGVAVFD